MGQPFACAAVIVLELHGRLVRADLEVVRNMRYPAGGPARSLPEHTLTDLDNQAAFLGQRNETHRTYLAVDRMCPTQQRLGLGDFSCEKIDDRMGELNSEVQLL